MFGKSKEDPDTEIFVIFDSKSASYGNPVFTANKNVLLRDVINMYRNPQDKNHPHYANAEDFAIFKTGTYSKKTGLVSSQNLEHIANFHDLKAQADTTGH